MKWGTQGRQQGRQARGPPPAAVPRSMRKPPQATMHRRQLAAPAAHAAMCPRASSRCFTSVPSGSGPWMCCHGSAPSPGSKLRWV